MVFGNYKACHATILNQIHGQPRGMLSADSALCSHVFLPQGTCTSVQIYMHSCVAINLYAEKCRRITKDNSETWESWCHLSLWIYTWLGLWFIALKRRTKVHSASALIVEVWWGEWAPPLPWIVGLLVTPDLVLVFGCWSYQQPWIWDQISDIRHSQPHVEKPVQMDSCLWST